MKKDINTECINQKDIYETENINNVECCKIQIEYYQYNSGSNRISKNLYIPTNKISTNDKFFPLLENGTELKFFECCFNGNTVFSLSIVNNTYRFIKDGSYVYKIDKRLKIKSKKGTFKTITSRTKDNYKKDCDELIQKIDNAIKVSEEDLEK